MLLPSTNLVQQVIVVLDLSCVFNIVSWLTFIIGIHCRHSS